MHNLQRYASPRTGRQLRVLLHLALLSQQNSVLAPAVAANCPMKFPVTSVCSSSTCCWMWISRWLESSSKVAEPPGQYTRGCGSITRAALTLPAQPSYRCGNFRKPQEGHDLPHHLLHLPVAPPLPVPPRCRREAVPLATHRQA